MSNKASLNHSSALLMLMLMELVDKDMAQMPTSEEDNFRSAAFSGFKRASSFMTYMVSKFQKDANAEFHAETWLPQGQGPGIVGKLRILPLSYLESLLGKEEDEVIALGQKPYIQLSLEMTGKFYDGLTSVEPSITIGLKCRDMMATNLMGMQLKALSLNHLRSLLRAGTVQFRLGEKIVELSTAQEIHECFRDLMIVANPRLDNQMEGPTLEIVVAPTRPADLLNGAAIVLCSLYAKIQREYFTSLAA